MRKFLVEWQDLRAVVYEGRRRRRREAGRAMRKRAKRWMGALTLFAGTLGMAVFLRRRKSMHAKESPDHSPRERSALDRWARPGMSVTFRAELMPERARAARTFHVAQLLPSGRVVLEGFAGEHAEAEFEPLRLN